METYRFNFSDAFKQSLIDFSNKHKHDDLDSFKDNFDTWCQINAIMIEDEKISLQRFGFNGNMKSKMFKSIRYYFMKRAHEKKAKPKERQKYICKDNVFLTNVKDHIQSVLNQNLKPSVAYDNFSEKYKIEIVRMKEMLMNKHLYEEKDALNKIKKIYKNKYFTESKK